MTCQCCFLCPVLLCERMCVSVCVCFNISDNYPKPSAFLCIFKPQCCSSHLAEPPLFIHVNPVFNGVTSKVLVWNRTKWRAAFFSFFFCLLNSHPWTETHTVKGAEFSLCENLCETTLRNRSLHVLISLCFLFFKGCELFYWGCSNSLEHTFFSSITRTSACLQQLSTRKCLLQASDQLRREYEPNAASWENVVVVFLFFIYWVDIYCIWLFTEGLSLFVWN